VRGAGETREIDGDAVRIPSRVTPVSAGGVKSRVDKKKQLQLPTRLEFFLPALPPARPLRPILLGMVSYCK
jgi:hypothetical protein